MRYWRMSLRENAAGWIWQCLNPRGEFVCCSPITFRSRWEAVQNFERWFEDYWATTSARLPDTANTDAEWVCEL